MRRVLIVDDDRAVRRTLELHLAEEGYEPVAAADGTEGVTKAVSEDVDLVLLDLRLPGIDGFEVLRRLKALQPALPVIVITAYDDMETAVEAIRLGATDHLGKPLDLDELDGVIHKALQILELQQGVEAVGPPVPADDVEPYVMVGRSRAIKKVFKAIGAVADSRTTVLIHGESGTGKELVARAIHFRSKFRDRPFVPVACSALAPSLLESELFGHERGAFTGAVETRPGKFELADGGTLFLDEISETSLDTQVKLLRFLQEREFHRVGGTRLIRADVRVVAATNRNILRLVEEGRFRRDLYYRLRVVSIELPPLRERPEDIPLLVRHFLRKIEQETGKSVRAVPPEVMRALMEHPWPGNVRELENALRRAVLLSPGPVLLPEALDLEGREDTNRIPLVVKSIQEVEREHIENVLRFTGYEKSRAARILNISRPTLNKRIREYGIRIPRR